MKKSLCHITICMILVLIVACASPDEKANKLFTESSLLIKSAQQTEKTSYSDALKIYEQALAKLERIISKYPSSQLAVKLTGDEDKVLIGSYTFKEYKEIILPEGKMKADAEENPFVCAFLAAKKIVNTDDKILAITEIVGKYAKTGQYEKVFRLIETIDADFIKAYALSEIAGKYADLGQKDKAAEILSRAFQLANVDAGGSITVSIFSNIAGKYFEAGEKDKASEILSQAFRIANRIEPYSSDTLSYMVSSSLKIRSLLEIFDKYEEGGQKDKAAEILSQAFQEVKNTINFPDSTRYLSDIAGKYAENGQYDSAVQIVKSIKSADDKVSTLSIIAGKCFEAGEKDKASKILSQAFQITNKIDYDSAKVSSLTEIAGKYAEAGQKDKASEILSQAFQILQKDRVLGIMKDLKVKKLTEIAGKYAVIGQKDKASEILSQAFQIATTIEGACDKASVLSIIAAKYFEAGQKDKASEILSQAFQIANTIGGKNQVFEEIADKWFVYEVGQYDHAIQLAKTIEDNSLKALVLFKMASKYADSGQKLDEKATKIMHEIIKELY